MNRTFKISFAAVIFSQFQSAPPVLAQVTTPPVTIAREDARLTAFLDAEFGEYLKQQPQLATRLGITDGGDRWNDISDTAAAVQLEWRKASVARMKSQFDRAALSPEAQVNFDIWALEADRAVMAQANRVFRPPFYSRLYSTHAQLPDFLVNTHSVADAVDLTNYIARLRGIPAVLDTAIARSNASSAAGIRAPKFQLESIIATSEKLVSGAPFGAGPDAALWADIKTKTEALVAARKLLRRDADVALADARTAIVALKPAYDRVIGWAKEELPKAPSGRVGAISLPGGAAYYANELKLNTTTDYTADQIHAIGRKEVARIEAEQDILAKQAGFSYRGASRIAALIMPNAPGFSRPDPMMMQHGPNIWPRPTLSSAKRERFLSPISRRCRPIASKWCANLRSAKWLVVRHMRQPPAPMVRDPREPTSTSSATPQIRQRSTRSCAMRRFLAITCRATSRCGSAADQNFARSRATWPLVRGGRYMPKRCARK